MSEQYMSMPRRMQEFNMAMQHQLNNVAFGEQEAVHAITVGLASGADIVLAGPPGGAKTELAKTTVSSIQGLSVENLADIPTQSDLSPARLIGSGVSVTKTIERNGVVETETTTSSIPGIIKPDTAIIFGDEINRVNPLAVNALLPVLSGRELPNDMGRTPMPNLLNGIFTMNPSERSQATFGLASAFIGRLGSGALIGASSLKSEEQRSDVIAGISQRAGSIDFAALPKIISIEELKAMRSHVANNIVMPGNGATQNYLAKTVMAMTDGLRDMRITDESDGRNAAQLARNAKTLAALGGRELVEPDDILDGAKMLSAARIATKSRDAYREIPQMHRKLEDL